MGLIRNCPVTVQDVKRALDIYGPDPCTLKSKTTKKKNKSIPEVVQTIIQPQIMERYKNIWLFMDIFYVNRNLFFHKISLHIKFRTVTAITNRKKAVLL